MQNNNLDALFRTDEDSKMSLDELKKFQNTKRRIKGICKALIIRTNKYKPQRTVESIDKYISSTNKLDRILYSEISSFIFSKEPYVRGVFVTNLEKLLLFSLDTDNNVTIDVQRIIVKIYDHVQLALYQIENTNNIFADSIEEAKENLHKQIKGVEKEYITILGIFASIVLAFVGGITFSTSVLQNISAVSIFRLLLTVDFLAFVLINTIYVLVKCIFEINDKNTDMFNIKIVNITCLVIACVIIGAWLLNMDKLQSFISNHLFLSKQQPRYISSSWKI